MKQSITLDEYVALCEAGGAHALTIRRIAQQTVDYYASGGDQRKALEVSQYLEAQWYASVRAGNPDYSVYDTDYYLAELWACWVTYSRKYITALTKPVIAGASIRQDLGPVRGVVDLGCGPGLTTGALKATFLEADVFGTNIERTPQMRMAKALGVPGHFTAGTLDAAATHFKESGAPVDLVFASEYFEHHPAPIHHLREVVDKLSPRALVVANSFGSRAIGHFEEYEVDGQRVPGKAASRAFGAELRARGYRKIETKLWNGRPSYWKRTN